MTGYESLREKAGWIDLSARGKIRLTGDDRARLLHAMTTNHIQQLTPGSGCYAFFLTAQGRIIGDANVLCFPEHFLLDTEPETRATLQEHLDKFIIADDVTLEDMTEGLASVAVEGPQAPEFLAALGAPLPQQPVSHFSWDSSVIAAISFTGASGYTVFVPSGEKESLVRRLESAGAVRATQEEARIVRMENGRARFGEDFNESHIPHETQLLHAVHFNKGCYIGQEIVERVRSRGLVNRLLVRLEIDSQQVPATGDEVQSAGKMAGRISSAALSPALGCVVAFAFLRREVVDAHPELTVAGAPARLRGTATPLLPQ